jgi:hypothetical protein
LFRQQVNAFVRIYASKFLWLYMSQASSPQTTGYLRFWRQRDTQINGKWTRKGRRKIGNAESWWQRSKTAWLVHGNKQRDCRSALCTDSRQCCVHKERLPVAWSAV